MLIAEELALVALDPGTGRHPLGARSNLNASLAGALVAELMVEGRAAPGPRTGHVVPVGPVAGGGKPPASSTLAAAAEVVAERGPKIKSVLSAMSRGIEKRLGYGTWEAALVGLAEEGLVALDGGLLARTDVLDTGRRDEIVARLQAAAHADGPLDNRTALLLNLTGPAMLLEVVAPERRGRRHVRHRIDHALDGTDYEIVGKLVRRVIADNYAGGGVAATGGAVAAGS